jgi:hypothetical protein
MPEYYTLDLLKDDIETLWESIKRRDLPAINRELYGEEINGEEKTSDYINDRPSETDSK